MMDNHFRWNVDGVLKNLREAEVMTILFPYLAKVLVLDLRHDTIDGPFIAIEDVLGSAQECVQRLSQLRPRLEPPDNLAILPWLGSVRSLSSTGALANLGERLARSDYTAAGAQLHHAYEELLRIEKAERQALIRGDAQRTRTLWQR